MGELLVCDLCGGDGKYRCPRCDTRSCSLTCVQQHKQISGCDGLRKKIKYVPMKKFTELDLVQDFKMLESVSAAVDKCQRDKLKRSTNQHVDGIMAPRMPFKRRKLEYEAARRGVHLKFLPPHFVRRKLNKSCFQTREKVLKWDVELKLPHANSTLKLDFVPDTTKLWKLVAPLMEPGVSQDVLGYKASDLQLNEQQIQEYQSMGYGGIIIYLRTETLSNRQRQHLNHDDKEGEKPARINRYTELDMKRSLRYNLRGHALVEHPCLEVVNMYEACNYRDQGYIELMPPPSTNNDKDQEDNSNGMDENNVDMEEFEEKEEIISTEADAYKKYYDFYFNYYNKKYTNPGENKPASGTTNSSYAESTIPSLPSAMSQLASKLSSIVSQDQRNQLIDNVSQSNYAKNEKPSDKLQNLNQKNAENARKIADEIRESAKVETANEKPIMANGALPGLGCYADSDSD